MADARQISHRILFAQGEGDARRSIVLSLDESFLPDAKEIGGRWRQRKGESQPEGIDLYPGFKYEDLLRLRWAWKEGEHGGLITIGVDTPSEDHQRGKYSYFKPWFSLRTAKRLANGQFRVAGKPYPEGEGVGMFERGGSSDTLAGGEGKWGVIWYDR